MIEEEYLKQELDKIKKDPKYIDYFTKIMSQKLGKNKYQMEKIIDEAILHYKDSVEYEAYGKLVWLQEKNYILHGQFEEGRQLGEQAYQVFERIEDKEGLLACYNILLICNMKLGGFERAMRCAVQGLALAEEEGNHVKHLNLLLNTSELYIMLREYKRARKILNQVLEMENLLTEERLLFIESALFELDLREGNLEDAALHCKKAYDVVNKYEEDTYYLAELVEILILRAELNLKRALYVQAEKDYKLAYQHAVTYQFMENQIKVLIRWGHYCYDRGQLACAEEKLQEAIQICESNAYNYLMKQVYEVLAVIYEKQKNWEAAFKCTKKVQQFQSQFCNEKLDVWLEQLNHKHMASEITHYKTLYEQMQKVAQIGACFTCNLKGTKIPEAIYRKVGMLLDLDLIGIAVYDKGIISYHAYELQEKWLDSKNDLVRYTERLAEHSIEFQQDIMVGDGNFEAYSLKTIKESQSEMKLKSTIIVPLKVEGIVLGAVVIGSYTNNAYSQNDLNTVRIIASYLAITIKNMNLYQQVVYLAEHDALTGVLTRGAILKKGEELFKESQKKHKKMAIIMFDTDYFKKVNDKYGHQLGDEVLKKVGEIMQQSIRSRDYAGRYGGEEFIVILNDISDDEVIRIAERIKVQLENTLFETKKEKNIKVTLSGGIYKCNEYTLNLDDAIRFADHALYRAKLLGRNRIMSYNLTESIS